MPIDKRVGRALATLLLFGAAPPPGAADSGLDHCLAERALPRVVRAIAPDGRVLYGRVVDESQGVPTAVVPLAEDGLPLAEVFERASGPAPAGVAGWMLSRDEVVSRLCAPVRLPQRAIDAEDRVVVAAGLNYAAHAEEAGGGDVFLFPKPVAPTPPYGVVAPPAGVTLLDYEVELGFVLLADVSLRALPSRDALLAQSAYFVVNDVSDREPIIRHKALTGPGTGFVEAKGQPDFLPTGPWMVRGTELFAALAACGEEGLGIALAVDEGEGFRPRQDANTSRMILDPLELLARIAEEVERSGLRSAMPVLRDGEPRHYPLAVDADAPRLPAGSVILTGTPDGVALQAPSTLPLLARALVRLRGPIEQFRLEERARAASGEPGGYLARGDRMRARIDGLGTQLVRVAEPGTQGPARGCE